MALYLGDSEKLKMMLGDIVQTLNIFSEVPITNGKLLLSSEGYILMDRNGLYITTKDGE